jgi:hypothetical protein
VAIVPSTKSKAWFHFWAPILRRANPAAVRT